MPPHTAAGRGAARRVVRAAAACPAAQESRLLLVPRPSCTRSTVREISIVGHQPIPALPALVEHRLRQGSVQGSGSQHTSMQGAATSRGSIGPAATVGPLHILMQGSGSQPTSCKERQQAEAALGPQQPSAHRPTALQHSATPHQHCSVGLPPTIPSSPHPNRTCPSSADRSCMV